MVVNKPLVSIIIPCYNCEGFIAEAIQSALDQTYPNKEVIVIDDGSTDGSLEVIKSFGDKIRWETGPNRGGSAARNRGIELARGELIQFLDADDVLLPQKLERQVNMAENALGMIACCYWQQCFFARNRPPSIKRLRNGHSDSVVFVLSHSQFAIEAPLHYRSQLLQIGGFRSDLAAAQEFDLHLRLAAAGYRFRVIPEVLFTVRTRQGSVSWDYVKAVQRRLEVIPPVVENLRRRGQLTEERAKAFAVFLASSGRGCIQRGAIEIGREFFRMSREIHPTAGIVGVYSPATRLLIRIAGPVLTEKLVQLKRRILNRKVKK